MIPGSIVASLIAVDGSRVLVSLCALTLARHRKKECPSINLPRPPTFLELPHEKNTPSEPEPGAPNGIQRMIQDVRHIHAAIGFSGSAILCVGGALAILCTMSAVQAGAPYPISFAAGFCTLACSAGFCAALAAILNVTGTVTPITEKPQPNYAAWKLAGRLRVSDASRLWCNIEPGCGRIRKILAWAQAMSPRVG